MHPVQLAHSSGLYAHALHTVMFAPKPYQTLRPDPGAHLAQHGLGLHAHALDAVAGR